MKHGSYSTYVNHKCRCPECKADNTRYHKEAREARKNRAIPLGTQHGFSTYTNWGCRCVTCCKGKRDHQRRYRKGRRER